MILVEPLNDKFCGLCELKLGPWKSLGGVVAGPPLLLPFVEDILYDRQRGEGTGPTCIEGDLRQYFGSLFLRQAIIHGTIEVVGPV